MKRSDETLKRNGGAIEKKLKSEVETTPGARLRVVPPGSIPRDIVEPIELPSCQNFLKIMSWNVNGFKAHVVNMLPVLSNIVNTYHPDVICFQETKLQEQHVTDEYRNILPGYRSYWNCSTIKKGYSGTAVFIRTATVNVSQTELLPFAAISNSAVVSSGVQPKKQTTLASIWGAKPPATKLTNVSLSKSSPAAVTTSAPSQANQERDKRVTDAKNISFDFEDDKRSFHGEGRTITVEFSHFYLVACYVPNSGEDKLVRLDYRVGEWDPFVRRYLNRLSARKPVVFTGDLNCGHLDIDMYNPHGKHTPQQAGLTPRERASFSMLLSTNFRDAFRFFYPDARGQFTYWSLRTFARPVNKGLRLDYFLCSRDMFPAGCNERDDGAAVMDADSSNSGKGTQSNNDEEQDLVSSTAMLNSSTVVAEKEAEAGAGAGAGALTPLTALRRADFNEGSVPAPGAYDCFILHKEAFGCSDHCPVMLVVKMDRAT